MNILILAAGDDHSSGDRKAYPLWLAELGGVTILERQVRRFAELQPNNFVFVFRRDDIQAFHLDEIVNLMAKDSAIVEIVRETQGAACSALLAIEAINQDAELVIISATDVIDVDMLKVVQSFRSRGADAGVITFASLHPRYSYVRCNEAGDVIEAAEKRPISRNATAGLFWFARASDFFSAVKAMIVKDASVNEVFFIAPALNEMILDHKKIVTETITLDQYHPIKSQQHVETFGQALERIVNETCSS